MNTSKARTKITISVCGVGIMVFLAMTIPASNVPYEADRAAMVEKQIRRRGITNEMVLDAMLAVKRHLFVPEEYRDQAYNDYPLEIGYGQTISQPYIVGYMTDSAHLSAQDTVLEIGTGSGYQAAVLGRIVKKVYTIEIIEPLASSAQKRVAELGYDNIEVICGDGYKGLPQYAPFDAIIVTAAPPELPMALVKQLKIGGRMIVPVGSFFQALYAVTRTEDGFTKEELLPVRFVPMVREQP